MSEETLLCLTYRYAKMLLYHFDPRYFSMHRTRKQAGKLESSMGIKSKIKFPDVIYYQVIWVILP